MNQENSAELLEKNTVSIKIFNRTYKIKCPPDKIDDLNKAARYLDEKVNELSKEGKVANMDSLITVVALNITYELLTQKRQNSQHIEAMNSQLIDLQAKIENALATEG